MTLQDALALIEGDRINGKAVLWDLRLSTSSDSRFYILGLRLEDEPFEDRRTYTSWPLADLPVNIVRQWACWRATTQRELLSR